MAGPNGPYRESRSFMVATGPQGPPPGRTRPLALCRAGSLRGQRHARGVGNDGEATLRPGEDLVPELLGIHYVRVPVADVVEARDWCVEIFGLTCILDYEEEAGIVGALLVHPSGLAVALHLAVHQSKALDGFADPFAPGWRPRGNAAVAEMAGSKSGPTRPDPIRAT